MRAGVARMMPLRPIAVEAQRLEAGREAARAKVPVETSGPNLAPMGIAAAGHMVDGHELGLRFTAAGAGVAVMIEDLLLQRDPFRLGALVRARLAMTAGGGLAISAQVEVTERQRALAVRTPARVGREHAVGPWLGAVRPMEALGALPHARLAANHKAVWPRAADAELDYWQREFTVAAHPVVHWDRV